ncbi:MAG: STAS domain-containing protein [Acidimicrobiia bacterium]|nr:STAS domain-containing protein [Acidimicrobiia bacterium]
MDFNVVVASQNGWEVLSISGEIDMATAPQFRKQLLDTINASLPTITPKLVLNLTSVDFIDSTGLGVLLGATKRVRGAGGDIRLVQNNPRLAELLAMTRLDQIIDVFASVAEATEGAAADAPSNTNSDASTGNDL